MAAAGVLDKERQHAVKDQILGVIYGNCMGDAIGLLTEFMTKQQAKEQYGQYSNLEYDHKLADMHRGRWKKGDWTDDSDQMIVIIESLLDCKGKADPIDLAKKLLSWTRKGFPELGDHVGMGIGSTTMHVMRHENYVANPHAAAEDIWKKTDCVVAANGCVMRTAVLGTYRFSSLDDVIENTMTFCKVTHADPRCVASCVAVTSSIVFMLRREDRHMTSDGNYDVNAIIVESYKTAKKHLGKKYYRKHKNELKHYMFARSLDKLKLDDKASIGYVYKAMGSGFWALKQSDFRTALQALLMEGGDADTNGAVAGAMLGCKLGASQLPESWLNGLLHKDWLDEKIDRFFKLLPELQETDREEPETKDE